MPGQDYDVVFGSEEDNNPYTADSVTLSHERRGKNAAASSALTRDSEPRFSDLHSKKSPNINTESTHMLGTVDEASDAHSHPGLGSQVAPAFNSTSDQTSPPSDAIDDEHDSDNDSLILYQQPAGDSSPEASKINRSGRVSQILAASEKPHILISEAGKSNEGLANASKRYVVYTIKVISGDSSKDEIQTRRRYSDFESLRDILTRIFPLLMIPPIPPKNYFSLNILSGLVNSGSLSTSPTMPVYSSASAGASATSNPVSSQDKSYPYINSSHLSKHRLVEHRKRLLANFLNNCLNIPRIQRHDFFAKFLDPAANWSDEISLISSQLPSSIYQSNPEDGLSTDPLYASLPLPVTGPALNLPFQNPLRSKKSTKSIFSGASSGQNTASPDTSNGTSAGTVSSSEPGQKLSTEYSIIKNSHLDDINKRIINNFIGLSSDYAELGAALNSFSITLSDSTAVSKDGNGGPETALVQITDDIGLAYESSGLTINGLIGDLETKYSEPLGEAFKFTSVYESTKSFRRKKEKQSRLVDQELQEKKRDLADSIRTELEVSKIESGIQSQSLKRSSSYTLSQNSPNTHPSPQSSGFKGRFLPSFKSVKKISKYVSDIMDQNPELTRKQKLVQLQERVSILEKCQKIVLSDIAYISNELEMNAKEFRNNELKTIINILLNYNRIFTSWARANMDIWEEVKEEINRILS